MNDDSLLRRDEDGVEDQESPVLLPSPNAGIGLSGEVSGTTTPQIIPQPILVESSDGEAPSLADRVEQALADDGRFASLVSRLAITTDNGVVHLSGPIANPDLKRSLIATVHAIPGVTDVQDSLSTE